MKLLYVWLLFGAIFAVGELVLARAINDAPPRRWPECLAWIGLCLALGPFLFLPIALVIKYGKKK